MKFICSFIAVSDIKRSRYFYEILLNQKPRFDFGENITYHGDFAIHLESHFKNLIDNKKIEHGGNNFELYFEYDDLEQIVKILKENNITFLHDIREQPWRQKVVRIYDPDQHIVEIGESLEYLSFRLKNEGLSNEEISKITNMPSDFMISAIDKFEEAL